MNAKGSNVLLCVAIFVIVGITGERPWNGCFFLFIYTKFYWSTNSALGLSIFITKTNACDLLKKYYALFLGTNAIMCYHCNSAYDPRCADPFNSFSLGIINCSAVAVADHVQALGIEHATLCRKTTQKGKFN
jgi:hypothetical protein